MLPSIFFGHGNPLFALESNAYTQGWARLVEGLPRPRAILCISAHWYVPFTAVTSAPSPRTIHDFGGFPRALYEIQYPAPGDAWLVQRVQEALAPEPVGLDASWGLDHGTWAVLRHAYPAADIPVVQLSLDQEQPAAVHYERGRKLAALRAEGVLVIGSGNLVHNLHTYAWGRHIAEPYAWATRFEHSARELMSTGQDARLIHYEQLGAEALLSAPTPEHFLPLLYVLGTRQPGEHVGFPVHGIDGGSISMLCVVVGAAA